MPRLLPGLVALAVIVPLSAVSVTEVEPAAAEIRMISPTPMMGWNEYYGLGGGPVLNEVTMKSVTDYIVANDLDDVGYDTVWLDGGWWYGERDANGVIVPDPVKFPKGMAELADYIHDKGLKAGIYTDVGQHGCGTAGGSAGHYQQDMDTFAAWGYDAVKVDFCGGRDELLDEKKAYEAISEAVMNNSSGRPMFLNLCNFLLDEKNTSWEYGPYTANSWRTGGDLGHRTTDWFWILRNFDHNSRHPGSNGPNHWNDADYLQLGQEGITETEAKAQFALWAIMATPMILGSDIRQFSAAELAIAKNTDIIAVNQDVLGVQAIKVKDTIVEPAGTARYNNTQVWSKKLEGWGNRAVALFNRSTTAQNISFTAADVGLSGSFAVRDLWAQADVAGTHSTYTVNVPSHGVAILKLTGANEDYATSAAVNAGGGAAGGFVADTHTYDGANYAVTTPINTAGITNPADQAVYQDARSGAAMQYYIPRLRPDNTYKVRLHFSENWEDSAGDRKFDVRINGTKVLDDFDVFAEAGFQANKAVVREFTVVATQGFISVDFSRGSAGVPLINGIGVASVANGTPVSTQEPEPKWTNLALNGTAKASSYAIDGAKHKSTFREFKANDTQKTTRWLAGSGNPGEWLEIDFGAAKTFNTTTLVEGNDRITSYKIQYHNGSTWVDVVANGTTIGAGKTDTFSAVTASRVRLLVNSTVASNGSNFAGIYDFAVYNNLGLGKAATASSTWNSTFAASKVTDGTITTRWNSASGTSAGQWVELNLGQPTTFNQLRTRETANYQRVLGHKVQYFNGTGWVDLASGTSIGTTRLHSFPAVTATKVRVLVTAATSTPSIDEIEVLYAP